MGNTQSRDRQMVINLQHSERRRRRARNVNSQVDETSVPAPAEDELPRHTVTVSEAQEAMDALLAATKGDANLFIPLKNALAGVVAVADILQVPLRGAPRVSV